MTKPRFIIVGGCGRSGTTLVQKLLVSHDQVSGGPEFGFTTPIFKLYGAMKASLKKDALTNYTSESHLKAQFKSFYKSFFNNYQEEGVIYISEKTPANIRAIDFILDGLDDALFLNVYRDGRGVLASHLKVQKRAVKKGKRIREISLRKVCRLWNDSIDQYVSVVESGKNIDRIYAIRYESLISNPKETYNNLLQFLNLDILPEAPEPSAIKFEDSKYDAHINDIWYTEEMYKQQFNPENIDKWKRELNFFQKIYANSVMSVNIDYLGYDVSGFWVSINKVLNSFSKKKVKKRLKGTLVHKTILNLRNA